MTANEVRSQHAREAETAHNEARVLIGDLVRLQLRPARGGGQAKAWQSLREEALDMLIRAGVQPAIVDLFTHLLKHTKVSATANKRVAAMHAAAKAEAGGAGRKEIHAAYAAKRGERNTLRPEKSEPLVIDRSEISRLRKMPYYLALVESYTHDE